MELQMDVGQLLTDAAREAGVDIKVTSQEAAAFVAERAAHLSTLVGQPGYDRAARAEAESVWLHATRRVVDVADARDAQVFGIIRGLLLATAAV